MHQVKVKWPVSDPEAMRLVMNVHRGSALEAVCSCGHRRRFSVRDLCEKFPNFMTTTVRTWREHLVCSACGGRPTKAWHCADPGAGAITRGSGHEARTDWMIRVAELFEEFGIPLPPVLPLLADPPPRDSLAAAGRSDLADALEAAGVKLPHI